MPGKLGNFLWRFLNPREGSARFQRGRGFVMPDDPLILDPAAKRVVTICNLFANQNQSVADIARLLDTKTSLVVSALMKGGVIADRRRSHKAVKRDRRAPKYHLPLIPETGRSISSKALCGVVCDETVSEFVFLQVIRDDERCYECSIQYHRCKHSSGSVTGLATGYSR